MKKEIPAVAIIAAVLACLGFVGFLVFKAFQAPEVSTPDPKVMREHLMGQQSGKMPERAAPPKNP